MMNHDQNESYIINTIRYAAFSICFLLVEYAVPACLVSDTLIH